MLNEKTINDFPPLLATQKFTHSRPFLNAVSLCSELDKLGILRPSMANGAISNLLLSRGYLENEKGALKSTQLGEKVVKFLIDSDFCFINPQFTADVEKELDLIADGSKDRIQMLQDFWTRLQSDIQNAQSLKEKNQKTDHKCPKCDDGYLLLKHSKFGAFYSCSNYKKPKKVKGKMTPQEGSCDYKANVGEQGEPVEAKKIEKEKIYADFKCSKCESPVVQRTSKYGKQFWGCSSYPTCKTVFNNDGTIVEYKKKTWKKYTKKTSPKNQD